MRNCLVENWCPLWIHGGQILCQGPQVFHRAESQAIKGVRVTHPETIFVSLHEHLFIAKLFLVFVLGLAEVAHLLHVLACVRQLQVEVPIMESPFITMEIAVREGGGPADTKRRIAVEMPLLPYHQRR